MQRFLAWGMLALAFTGQAAAADLVRAQAWVVGTHVSEPEETREAFVQRLARTMQAWTDEHRAEVCGYLATDGQRWGATLTTQRSQVMCIMDKDLVPAGFWADKDSIHSHPRADARGKVVLAEGTRQAARAIGETVTGNSVDIAYGFSGNDRRNGAGYLVADGRLLHFNGRNRVRDFGPIPE